MNGRKDYRKDYSEVMSEHFPEDITISVGGQTLRYRKKTWNIRDEQSGEMLRRGLRYGENPGQQAALYELVEGKLELGDCAYMGAGEGLVSALSEQNILQIGKHPSMNNLTDVDSALGILRYLMEKPTVVIVKHNNPSGVAERDTLVEAYREANFADRVAAFGGVAVFNRKVDRASAEEIVKNYLEVVCAPDFADEALELLREKKNLRILKMPRIAELGAYAGRRFLDFKALIGGGLLVQQSPLLSVHGASDLAPASAAYRGRQYAVERMPTEDEMADLLFGWKVEQGVTSNSVIYTKNRATVAIGTGGQDRVGVAEMAVRKAYSKYADRICFERHGMPYWVLERKIRDGERDGELKSEIDAEVERQKGGLLGAVMVSDGFFPFRDTVDVAAKYGIAAIVQPGGSMRDFESIEACNEHGIAMVFTGIRAFKH